LFLETMRTLSDRDIPSAGVRGQALRREADGRALVLLDELGTGTDPAEGAALGIALLRALAAGGARGAALTIATTHHRCKATTTGGPNLWMSLGRHGGSGNGGQHLNC
jgi:hypothetical protein